jgi:hypothetical protein
MLSSRTVAVSIDRSPADVAAFVRDAGNLPRWAKGLCTAIRRAGDEWIGETPRGEVRIRFGPENALGVLDHHVRVASGQEVHVPMRVVANGSGSEVMLTVFRAPDMSDEQLEADLRLVERDLGALRRLLQR